MKALSIFVAAAAAIVASQAFAAEKTVKAKVTKERAQEAALKAVAGTVLNWDLEAEHGVPIYSFDIKGTDNRISEVEINGNTGKKEEISIEVESGGAGGDRKTTNANDLAKFKKVNLTKDMAQEKALKKFPGKVEQWESEIDEGKPVYEFLIIGKDSSKKVVAVNANTGAIVESSTYLDGDGF